MSFNNETASAAGTKGGGKRWRNKLRSTVRDKQLKISITETERNAIVKKAKDYGISQAELIIKSVNDYKGS